MSCAIKDPVREWTARELPRPFHASLGVAPLALLLVVTTWTYWGVRLNPFHFDDALFLQSPPVTTPGNPWYLLKPSQTRQLTYLSFYWNYRIWGMRPEGYHIFNLLLHCVNTLGVFAFTLLVCRLRPSESRRESGSWVALVAAGIFALHPVQSEVVNYVYQRATLLATFFSLAALVSFLQSLRSNRARFWMVISAICVALGALSKEVALVTPLLMMLLAWAFSTGPTAQPPVLRRSRTLLLVLSLLTISGTAWVLYNLHLKGESTVGVGSMRHSIAYLVSQGQVAIAYLRLIFWPSGLVIDHAFQPAPALSAYSLFCWLMLAGLAISFAAVRRARPEIAFLGLGFFILLLPTSSIIPSADLMFEHRLYLPMIAGSGLLAWLSLRLCRLALREEKSWKALWLALALVALSGCAFASRQRTYVWGDNIRLWSDAAAKVPSNARAHYNLGVAYLGTDRQAAFREFQRTIELRPTHAAAMYNLGWLEQTDGRLDAARGYYEAAIRSDPGSWQAHVNLANLCTLQGRPTEAIKEYRAAINLRKDDWAAYESLASVQIQSGNPGAALMTLEEVISLRPDLLEARYLKAYALAQANRREEAEAEIRVISAKDRSGIYAQKILELQTYLETLPAGKSRTGQP